jgi:hypothetical protein
MRRRDLKEIKADGHAKKADAKKAMKDMAESKSLEPL